MMISLQKYNNLLRTTNLSSYFSALAAASVGVIHENALHPTSDAGRFLLGCHGSLLSPIINLLY
jgi:hypothetical protein